jgi:hypothetical protein
LIDYDSFISFCKTLIAQPLQTLWMYKKFYLTSVDKQRMDWIVKSINKPRWSRIDYIQSYLNGYEKTKSLRPKDYKELTTTDGKKLKTTEASYILPLIDLYNKEIERL